MRVLVNDREIDSMSVERSSSHLLDSLKNLFGELFSAGQASQNEALDLLQASKGFDPMKNPQSLVFPRTVLKERVTDKRLPVRKAA